MKVSSGSRQKTHSSTISNLQGESSFNGNSVDNVVDEFWRNHVDKIRNRCQKIGFSLHLTYLELIKNMGRGAFKEVILHVDLKEPEQLAADQIWFDFALNVISVLKLLDKYVLRTKLPRPLPPP